MTTSAVVSVRRQFLHEFKVQVHSVLLANGYWLDQGHFSYFLSINFIFVPASVAHAHPLALLSLLFKDFLDSSFHSFRLMISFGGGGWDVRV